MFGSRSVPWYQRDQWKKREEAERRLASLEDRNAVDAMRRAICERRGIKLGEYLTRLDQWRYYRFLLTRARDEREAKEVKKQQNKDYDALLTVMADKRRRRAGEVEETEFAAQLDELREEYPPPKRLDESFKGC